MFTQGAVKGTAALILPYSLSPDFILTNCSQFRDPRLDDCPKEMSLGSLQMPPSHTWRRVVGSVSLSQFLLCPPPLIFTMSWDQEINQALLQSEQTVSSYLETLRCQGVSEGCQEGEYPAASCAACTASTNWLWAPEHCWGVGSGQRVVALLLACCLFPKVTELSQHPQL